MKVLVACEFSGIVRDAFIKQGHIAMSCDLLPSNSIKHHWQGDVREILNDGWDLIIAHPPCTRLCNSGVMWLEKRDLWIELQEAANFFRKFLGADCYRIAVENPIPHKYAIERIGRKYDQIIQPYMFGHTERKATCLWLKNLPELQATKDVKAEMELLPKSVSQRIHWISPGQDRGKKRSITFQGIADAMAEQWG